MKAAPFAYVRPATVDDVLAEIDADPDAKLLAGGQSLVPVLAMRLARPTTLVDLTAAAGLDAFDREGATLRIGAAVRQRTVEHSMLAAAVPLVGMALPWVGHREIRSRGTVCGSLAHADPAAELPAVACCLDAEVEATGLDGSRRIAARDLFTSAMTTALAPGELLTSVRLPVAGAGDGYALAEIARRHGDYALAGVAVHVHADDGDPTVANVTAFGVADRPMTTSLATQLRTAVDRVGPDRDSLVDALRNPAAAATDPLVTTEGDQHGSPAYRKRILGLLAARGLADAYLRATDPSTTASTTKDAA